MHKRLEEALRQELWEMELPQDAELELIREKEGVAVCRVRLPEQTCILKYFSRDEDCREITVYQLLGFAGLPSIPLLMYTKRSLLMEGSAWRRKRTSGIRSESASWPDGIGRSIGQAGRQERFRASGGRQTRLRRRGWSCFGSGWAPIRVRS